MNRKGFTLIEVLIVVVIIAVLAALILPRFMSQTERAVIAEAQQMLGAIRRGQLTWQDLTGATGNPPAISPIATACGAGTGCVAAEWAPIGVTPPTGGGYTYGCAGNTCTATRVLAGSTHNGSTVTLGISTGTFGCTGTYSPVGNNRGCSAQ